MLFERQSPFCKPRTEYVYKLMRDPSNIKDSNAVAIVRGKSGEKETQQADDVHPNNVTDRFEVIGHVPALMAVWFKSKFLKRHTNCAKVIIKGKRLKRGGGYSLKVPCKYIFEGDSFSCGWQQAKLIKEEFDVHCGGPSKAYWPKQNHSYTVLCISCCV